MADYIYSMETRLTPDQQKGVNLVQEIARHAGLNLYLTGGTIRDLVTGFPIRDIDLSIQGNPLKLQRDFEKVGITTQGIDEDLKTMHLLMPGNVRAEINMTRSEVYDKPGKPPTITPATINEDLRRRDFTVNAMALSLNPGSRGLLLDPFNGIADIEAKVLRILHNYAFLEDPVRLIRAVRLGARFSWPLEERTQARYDAAKENDYIQYLSKRALGPEVEHVAQEDDPLNVMRALDKEGWLQLLHPHFNMAKIDATDVNEVIKQRQMMAEFGYIVETGPMVMYFLTKRMGEKDIHDLQRMIPRRDFIDKWKHLEHGAQELAKKLTGKDANSVSGSWKVLTNATPENILFLILTTKNHSVEQKLSNFFGKWRQVREKLPFLEMAEMRITAQLPEYQKILDEAFLQLLDGKLRNHNEIVNFLKPYEPPPPPPPPQKRGRGKAAAQPAGGEGAPAAPAKRGRKPKGAPAATPAITAEAAGPTVQPPKGAAPLPAKQVATKQPAKAEEGKKPAPPHKAEKKSVAKHAPPAKPQPKTASPKKAVPAKKAPPKKAATAKKSAAKKPAGKKAPAKKKAAKR